MGMSAAYEDLEIERDELRARLEAIEEQAVYNFYVERFVGGDYGRDGWVRNSPSFGNNADAQTYKQQCERGSEEQWRVSRAMIVTFREVME